ncbi:hypothetical protein Z948_1880 [Sulfitobacter donghicola DSW-25 = KCTC 12864 = JCM 14565]|nr:hypothetical protein Z948_1880 [Sulfitobacter donghicola DSW-25 = KCTC 12864 = JCM 14565]
MRRICAFSQGPRANSPCAKMFKTKKAPMHHCIGAFETLENAIRLR